MCTQLGPVVIRFACALGASTLLACSESNCPKGYERHGTKCFTTSGDAGTTGHENDEPDTGATIPRQACDRNADCTHAERSRCDLTKHEGASCTTSAQCSGVSNAPVCVAGGGCFPCSDTDTSKCPTGRTLCEPTTHQCVRCVDTINETTCAGGQHCLDNECVQCRNAMDCPLATASVCNAQHQCEGCNANSDCDQIAGKTLCNTGEHTCVSC